MGELAKKQGEDDDRATSSLSMGGEENGALRMIDFGSVADEPIAPPPINGTARAALLRAAATPALEDIYYDQLRQITNGEEICEVYNGFLLQGPNQKQLDAFLAALRRKRGDIQKSREPVTQDEQENSQFIRENQAILENLRQAIIEDVLQNKPLLETLLQEHSFTHPLEGIAGLVKQWIHRKKRRYHTLENVIQDAELRNAEASTIMALKIAQLEPVVAKHKLEVVPSLKIRAYLYGPVTEDNIDLPRTLEQDSHPNGVTEYLQWSAESPAAFRIDILHGLNVRKIANAACAKPIDDFITAIEDIEKAASQAIQ